ncbi:PXA domain-containing protein [Gymnopilus junonius]|uniref:PXA domain-containing protein n=1 Tax=Gymnopilus junonius TaxID=109634 RepID=A0A9P5P0G9_GYMJU|nr:PXA domain-containing protein [Gymnopilus junonius]
MPPSLASRLLFHSQPAPQLFNDTNVSPELTPEIYDFIALALRAFVSPWWSKITRYDKDFLPHITAILTKVIHVFVLRLQGVDLPDFFFHDVPVILSQHYRDYRNAAAKTHTAYASGGSTSLSSLFAQLQPHMAISPEGILDKEYYRQIVDHILKVCLPPEDYEPEAEHIIIREVIVKVLIDDVIPKIVQPWFINRTILDLIGPPEEPLYTSYTTPATPTSSTSHNFIVLVLSILQTFSGMCLAFMHSYKQAMTTIKLVQQSPSHTPRPSFTPHVQSVAEPIAREPSTTSAKSTTSSISSSHNSSTLFSTTPMVPNTPMQHNYAEQPLILLSELVSSQDHFSTSMTFTTISMVASSMTPFLDKLLPHMMYTFLSPTFILNTTRTAKRTLFPNGYPGPSPPIPSPEEQAEWRAKLIAWRGRGSIALFLPLILGDNPSYTLGAALDPISNEHCNLHLVVFLLDRILLALFPELVGSPL